MVFPNEMKFVVFEMDLTCPTNCRELQIPSPLLSACPKLVWIRLTDAIAG
jgi:hypothetical protein